MNVAPELPPWAALMVALLVLLGSGFTLTGAIGLVRLETFYTRVHAPTMATSGGIASLVVAAILGSSVGEGRIVLEAALLFLFITITMPVAFVLLARAALFRDRAEGNPDVPPPIGIVATDGDPWQRRGPAAGLDASAAPGVDPDDGGRGGAVDASRLAAEEGHAP